MIFKEIQELKKQSLYNREILEFLDTILYSKVYIGKPFSGVCPQEETYENYVQNGWHPFGGGW